MLSVASAVSAPSSNIQIAPCLPSCVPDIAESYYLDDAVVLVDSNRHQPDSWHPALGRLCLPCSQEEAAVHTHTSGCAWCCTTRRCCGPEYCHGALSCPCLSVSSSPIPSQCLIPCITHPLLSVWALTRANTCNFMMMKWLQVMHSN